MKRTVTLETMNLQEYSPGVARNIGRNKVQQPERIARCSQLRTQRRLAQIEKADKRYADALRRMNFQVL